MINDAAVVGAGPSGLIAARELAIKGFRVKVYEEHERIGEPNHCAGILSVTGLKRLGVKLSRDIIQHEIKGGIIYSPSGNQIRIKGNKIRAYVVNRTNFDRFLAEKVHDLGADIEKGHRIRKFIFSNGFVTGIQERGGEFSTKVVIDAEGVRGALAKNLDFYEGLKGILSGINMEVSGVDLEPHMVEVWVGREFASGLFAWVVPTSERTARCGLACSDGNVLIKLIQFLRKRFVTFESSNSVIWPVITGGPIKKTYGNGIMLVGDVAGQTKATTGGGVILGGLCSIEAGRTAVEALEAEDCSSNFLRRYETHWRQKFGKEYSTMLKIRRIANKLSDPNLEILFESVKRRGLDDVLEKLVEKGDMDMQDSFIKSVLSHHEIISAFAEALGRLFLSQLRDLIKL